MPGFLLEQQDPLTHTHEENDEELLQGVTWLLGLRKSSTEIGHVLQTTKALRGFQSDQSQMSPLRIEDKVNLGVQEINKKRKRATRDEVAILRKAFLTNPLPTQDARQKIASQLDWTPRKVKIWFQNERAKLRKRGKDGSSSKDFSGNESPDSPDLTLPTSSLSGTSIPVVVPSLNLPLNRFSSNNFPSLIFTRYPSLQPSPVNPVFASSFANKI